MRSMTLLCTIGISLIIVVIIFGLIHLTADSNLNADQTDIRAALHNGKSSTESLKILNHRIKPFFSSEIVKGQVKNKGPGQRRYALINVNFYKNGNLIYSGSTNLKDIAPSEIKDFEVIYQGHGGSPDSYEINLGLSL